MPRKVLIVEDDKNIADLLRMYLEKEEMVCQVAGGGLEGLEKFQQFHPDLVLLDIMLPGMDGWAVCKKIRETSKTPIIMLTAKGELEDKVSGLEMGADDYITKPFETKEVLARVHAVLRRMTGEEQVSKRLSFDKLVVDLDSYELLVNGRRVDTPPPRSWSCCSIWRQRPIGYLPAINCWMRCGDLTILGTVVLWMCISSGYGKSWRGSQTNGVSKPSGAWVTNLR